MTAILSKPSKTKILRGGHTPKHQNLREVLLEQIGSGELGSGQRVPSESELIAQFQVSNTTVRRCLNDLAREGYIHRQRGRGSFVSELAATALHASFGILCTSIAASSAAPSFTAQLTGLEKFASESGDRVELFTTRGLERANRPAHALAQLVQKRELKGLFIISPIPSAWFSELTNGAFPLVSVNIDYPDLDIPRVLGDTESLAFLAGNHLIDLGHRRIAAMLGHMRQTASTIPGAAVRAQAGLDRLVATHPGVQTQTILYDYFDKDATRRQIADLLRHGPQCPTALIVTEDTLARSAWDLAAEAGLNVPADLSIISLQGMAPNYGLTTCICNYDNFCWRASRIMEQLVSGERPARLRELVGGSLRVGQSTGSCRKSDPCV